MIVELIGCTGAGKTTLAHLLREEGIESGRMVATMSDLVLDRPVLRRISNPTLMNLAQEAGGLPFLVWALRRRNEFLSFAALTLVSRAPSVFHKANRLRGVARRVGMYELADRMAKGRIVLSDEGTVLLAYLFVLTDSDYDIRDVERFARLVPLPEVIVHVRAPVEVLIERAQLRSDRRRQLGGKAPAELERLVRRTVGVFDQLVATPPIRERVIAVDNNDDDPAGRLRLVEDLAARVRERMSAGVERRPFSQPLRSEPGA